MSRPLNLTIVSDIHYASPAEQARGDDYVWRGLTSPLARTLLRAYRRHIWLSHPLRQNYLLDRFLDPAGTPDYVVANGDFCCDTAYLGVSDDAALQSAL